MMRKIRLRVNLLEGRVAPAELLHTLFPDLTGPQERAQFGISVATGVNYRVVGAALSDALGFYDAGQAFVYDVATNNLIATLDSPTPASDDQFGTSVAVSGKYVVVGAYRDDTNKMDSGSAYVYDLSSMTPTVP